MTEQVTDFRIRPVFEAPQYASVQPMPNYTVTRSGTDCGAIALVGIIAAVVLALVGLGFYNLGCHDKACYDAVAAVGVARANASAGVPTDVGANGTIVACTGKCWDAQKVKEVAQANARAGFGSNSGTDTVTAVAPPNNIAAPASKVKVIYVTTPAPAPAYAPTARVHRRGYIPGAPRNRTECIARGGTDIGRGCEGYI